jgi:hypothetical protein
MAALGQQQPLKMHYNSDLSGWIRVLTGRSPVNYRKSQF